MITKTEVLKVTPSLALKIVNEQKHEQGRKIRKWYVDYLAGLMVDEKFRDNSVIQFAKNGTGGYILTDGNHRVNAVIKSGRAQSFVAVYNEVDNIQELYRVTDVGLGRTFRDVAGDLAESVGLKPSELNFIAAAVKQMSRMKSKADYILLTKDYNQMSELIADWSPYYLRVYECVSGAPTLYTNRLKTASVMSLAMLTFRYMPYHAERFWGNICFEIGDHKSTCRTIGRFLLQTKRTDRDLLYTSVQIQNAITGAWNNFCAGREVSRLYPNKTQELNFQWSL